MSDINIKAIAKIAGVSYSTVSRVLNNKTYVNEDTRKKVLEVINDVGYKPNYFAQSLKNGSSKTIGLIIPSITNGIYGPVCEGVSDYARECGYTVILCNTNEDIKCENEFIEKMKERFVDGFIIASSRGKKQNIEKLIEEKVPLALITRYRKEDIGKTDIVCIDNYKGAYDGTKYLINHGCKSIAFAAGDNGLFFYEERLRGYKDALNSVGIKVNEDLIMSRNDESNDFYQLTKDLLKRNKVDAFFAASDPKAITILRALHDMNIKVPEEISLLGFDDIEICSMLNPTLSTVAQPLYEFGRRAAKSVIKQIEYKNENGELPKPRQHIMEHKLVIRQSTK